MSSGPLLWERRIVPARPARKTILSTPGAALAAWIVWRSDPAPLSLRFVTVNVAASAPELPRARTVAAVRRVRRSLNLMVGYSSFVSFAGGPGQLRGSRLGEDREVDRGRNRLARGDSDPRNEHEARVPGSHRL